MRRIYFPIFQPGGRFGVSKTIRQMEFTQILVVLQLLTTPDEICWSFNQDVDLIVWSIFLSVFW